MSRVEWRRAVWSPLYRNVRWLVHANGAFMMNTLFLYRRRLYRLLFWADHGLINYSLLSMGQTILLLCKLRQNVPSCSRAGFNIDYKWREFVAYANNLVQYAFHSSTLDSFRTEHCTACVTSSSWDHRGSSVELELDDPVRSPYRRLETTS